MDISFLNTARLKNLLKLTEVRDTLLANLQKVEEQINSSFSGQPASATVSAPKVGKRRGRKPGKKVSSDLSRAEIPAAGVSDVKSAKKVSQGSGRRGALKDQILSLLKEAGPKGVSVKDLSNKLGVKPQNVHVWFSTTGKTAGIKKVSPGVYRLK